MGKRIKTRQIFQWMCGIGGALGFFAFEHVTRVPQGALPDHAHVQWAISPSGPAVLLGVAAVALGLVGLFGVALSPNKRSVTTEIEEKPITFNFFQRLKMLPYGIVVMIIWLDIDTLHVFFFNPTYSGEALFGTYLVWIGGAVGIVLMVWNLWRSTDSTTGQSTLLRRIGSVFVGALAPSIRRIGK